MKANRKAKRCQRAISIMPLIEALVDGKYLEFKHDDGEWRMWDGFNLSGITLSPHRFRIAT